MAPYLHALSLLLSQVSLLSMATSLHATTASSDQLAVTCTFSGGCAIDVDGTQWSASNITKIRANGQWCSSADGTLEPKTEGPISGSDAMGDFSGSSLLWSCNGVPFETSVRVYNTPYGDAAVFSQHWPAGAAGTALGAPKVPGPGGVQEQVASAFPAISPTDESAQKYMVVYNQVSHTCLRVVAVCGLCLRVLAHCLARGFGRADGRWDG